MQPDNNITSCQRCAVQALCLSGLSGPELAQVDALVSARHTVPRGAPLTHAGIHSVSLHAIRNGAVKTCTTSANGRNQITGFHLAGELVGLERIGAPSPYSHTVALTDCEICDLPYHRLEELSRTVPPLQRLIHRLMSREIIHKGRQILLLGSMQAKERLASFLCDLGQRLHLRGHSHTELVLHMSREELASYLGIKLETVSRVFAALVEQQVIEVRRRRVRVLDHGVLHRLAGAHQNHNNCVTNLKSRSCG